MQTNSKQTQLLDLLTVDDMYDDVNINDLVNYNGEDDNY